MSNIDPSIQRRIDNLQEGAYCLPVRVLIMKAFDMGRLQGRLDVTDKYKYCPNCGSLFKYRKGEEKR